MRHALGQLSLFPDNSPRKSMPDLPVGGQMGDVRRRKPDIPSGHFLNYLPSFYRNIAKLVLAGEWSVDKRREIGPVEKALRELVKEEAISRFVLGMNGSPTRDEFTRRNRRLGEKESISRREEWLFAAWNADLYVIGNERGELRLPYGWAIRQLAEALTWRYGAEIALRQWQELTFPLRIPGLRYSLLRFIGSMGMFEGLPLYYRIFEIAGGGAVSGEMSPKFREYAREYQQRKQRYVQARINAYFISLRGANACVPFPKAPREAIVFKGPYLPVIAIPLLETWLGYRIVTTNWPVVQDKVAPFGLMKNLLVIAATSNSTWLLDIVKDWERRVSLMQKEQGDEITASLLAEMKYILEGISPLGQFDDLSAVEIGG